MRKLTKVTASILSAAMLMGTLAGCGAKQPVAEETTAATTTTESQVEVSTEVAEPVEMTQITWWSGDLHDKALMEGLVGDFNATIGKEKGIEIVYKVVGGDSYSQYLALAFESGETPDLFNGSGGSLKNYVASNYIIAYDDLPNGAELVAEYETLIPMSDVLDGKAWRLPIGSTTQALIYNKDMFKAAGLVDENGEATPPKTWDEVREYAKILTNEAERQYGIIFPVKWGGSWIDSDLMHPAMASVGYYNGFNKATGQFDFSCMKEPMEALLGMKEDGSVYPGADSIDNDSARAIFAEGSIGMKFAYSWDVGVLNEQFPAQCDWGVAPYPTVEEGVRYASRMSLTRSPFIHANAADKLEKIEVVIEWLLSAEVVGARYAAGSLLPADFDLVKDIELGEDAPTGWAEFAAIAAISESQNVSLSTDLSGERTVKDTWLDVYAGNTTVDDAIEELNERMNRAIETYYAAHPDEKEADYNAYVDENWTPIKYEWDY